MSLLEQLLAVRGQIAALHAQVTAMIDTLGTADDDAPRTPRTMGDTPITTPGTTGANKET